MSVSLTSLAVSIYSWVLCMGTPDSTLGPHTESQCYSSFRVVAVNWLISGQAVNETRSEVD